VAGSGSLTRTFIPPLLFFASGSASGLYAGYCIHTACFAGVAFWILRRQRHPATGSAVNITPVYDGPLFVSLALANWTLTGVNRWIVAWAYGETTAGLFTLASNIALIVPAVTGAIFLQYFQPSLFAMVDAEGKGPLKQLARRVDQVVLGLCAVGLIGLGIVRFITPWLIGSLIARPYAEALDWILPAGCFGLTVTAAQFYHVFMIAIRKERACASVDLSTAGVLTLGCIVTAWLGTHVFAVWLTLTPLILLITTRPLARRLALHEFDLGAVLPSPQK
jgi:O-antigen/teichoic acid export membrane protein